ncbi:hypothetical protein GDO86_014076 [Hymenochirus boettgeri]|uniref:Uncharacterized protein n=1 Tax=Hymenochirus boettgeri TaxID=247094 RepID=A0A8T2JMP6_9PIPI|nr:hypothetical protein GDO86_014076 [Hymenochirus boettgeri]
MAETPMSNNLNLLKTPKGNGKTFSLGHLTTLLPDLPLISPFEEVKKRGKRRQRPVENEEKEAIPVGQPLPTVSQWLNPNVIQKDVRGNKWDNNKVSM